ncbi:MAG: hypothetical protein RL112_784 [Planctomycetota bacterium]|jgi:uncharacterized protein (TIGR02722 family)
MNAKLLVPALCLLSLAASCGSPAKRVDPSGNAGLTTTEDINFKDWQVAAAAMVESLKGDPVMAPYNVDNRAIMMVSNVKNKTSLHLDTNLLTDKIRIDLRKSGKVLTTTAVGAGGKAEEEASAQVRELKDDPMFDSSTVQQDGTAVAPKFALGGTITQIKTKSGRDKESYFNFKLTLTDLKTGLAVWEDEKEVVKQETRPLIGG